MEGERQNARSYVGGHPILRRGVPRHTIGGHPIERSPVSSRPRPHIIGTGLDPVDVRAPLRRGGIPHEPSRGAQAGDRALDRPLREVAFFGETRDSHGGLAGRVVDVGEDHQEHEPFCRREPRGGTDRAHGREVADRGGGRRGRPRARGDGGKVARTNVRRACVRGGRMC